MSLGTVLDINVPLDTLGAHEGEQSCAELLNTALLASVVVLHRG